MGENKKMDIMVIMDENPEENILVEKEPQPVLAHVLAYRHLLQNFSKEEV